MYRTALRWSPGALRAIRPTAFTSTSRRFLSTSPAAKKRTWKGAGVRWGLAIAAMYFYNTSPIFADEAARTCPSGRSVWFATDIVPIQLK